MCSAVITDTDDCDSLWVCTGATCATFVWFGVRIIMQSRANPRQYLKQKRCALPEGFQFWFDTCAMLSILFDLGWLYDGISSQPLDYNSTGVSAAQLRISTLRQLRSIRTVQFAQTVYTHLSLLNCKRPPGHLHEVVPAKVVDARGSQSIATLKSIRRSSEDSVDSSSSGGSSQMQKRLSRIGQAVGNKITHRVTILVLVMLFVVPFIDGEYVDWAMATAMRSGFEMLHRMPQDLNVTDVVFEEFVKQFDQEVTDLVYLEVCSRGCWNIWTPPTIFSILNQSRKSTESDSGDKHSVLWENPAARLLEDAEAVPAKFVHLASHAEHVI